VRFALVPSNIFPLDRHHRAWARGSFLRCIEAQEWKNIFSSSFAPTLDNRNEFNRKAKISSAGVDAGRERERARGSQEKHIYDVQMILKSVCGNSRLVSLALTRSGLFIFQLSSALRCLTGLVIRTGDFHKQRHFSAVVGS
jgi:hypothetical protein